MLKLYFSTAIRHLLRNKAFTLLNIVGLALGMAGLTAIIVAVLAIGYQSVRAARVNPAQSLRTE